MATPQFKSLTSIPSVNAILDGGYYWAGARPNGSTIITINFIGMSTSEPDATFFWEDEAFFAGMFVYEKYAGIDLTHVMSPTIPNILIETGTVQQFPQLVLPNGKPAAAQQNGPFDTVTVGAVEQARGWYNNTFLGWNEQGLKVGGFGFWTVVHEFGHALGLKHPTDGGESNTNPQRLSGALEILDDAIFTVMSNDIGALNSDGWYDVGVDQLTIPGVENYGYVSGLGPLDLAAIQYLYGAKASADFDRDGNINDRIRLPSKNAPGTFWTTIWDTGGVDEIYFDGSKDCRISLESFSCKSPVSTSLGALNLISQVNKVLGGFIIADDFTDAIKNVQGQTGVIIENASGGSGDDILYGNRVDNVLKGNKGGDELIGGRGADKLYAGSDSDRDLFIFVSKHDSGTAAGKFDKIYGFDRANGPSDTTSDKLDFQELDADPAAGDQEFRFVKKFSAPSGSEVDGQIRVVDAGNNVNVLVDLNGDNVADMKIQVMNIDLLTKSDFIL